VSRRPGTVGRSGAALAASAESAVPLSQPPVARVADGHRLPKAIGFGIFTAVLAALWEAVPTLAGWLLALPLHWHMLSAGTPLFQPYRMMSWLLTEGGVHDASGILRATLLVLVIGVVGFVCSYGVTPLSRPWHRLTTARAKLRIHGKQG
jgi:hypothetical protein